MYKMSLKTSLLSRLNKFVPNSIQSKFLDRTWHLHAQGVDISIIDRNVDSEVSGAKRFMINNFYREAPIPLALRLANPKEIKAFDPTRHLTE